MSRLPPLAAVRTFEAAGRLQNFSRAAEELGLTQAAVSYQVRQLEDRLGRALFVREKGRVRLSETGQRLLPRSEIGLDVIAPGVGGGDQLVGAAVEQLRGPGLLPCELVST